MTLSTDQFDGENLPELILKSFDASPSLMTISRLSDGAYIVVNRRFEEVTGFSAYEVIGKNSLELNLWNNPESRAKVINLLMEQGSLRNLELNFRTKSGEMREGLFSAEIIDFKDERCLLSVVHDISDIKKLHRDMVRLERLNLIGQMAASIGHEVRNPMTCVRGFLQMFLNKEEFSKDKDLFEIMINELDRANSIISEFLSLSKDKPTVFKIKNLNKIIDALAPLIIADSLAQQQNVKFELGPVFEIDLNEEEIRQLVLNLTRNGIEAMTAGGELIIETYQDDTEVILSIQDQGRGITDEVLEKIGTPFFTTKDQGTGLGMAVCYRIAERHGAVINIKTSNSGTTIFVRFKSSDPDGQRKTLK